MAFNGNSGYCNSNSYCVAADDRVVRSLPWVFRVAVPGFEAGWPVR